MIRLTAVTLQGRGAPIQNWEIYINPDHVLTISKESGKTKILMSDNQIIHVIENPIDVVKLILKSKAMFIQKSSASTDIPPLP